MPYKLGDTLHSKNWGWGLFAQFEISCLTSTCPSWQKSPWLECRESFGVYMGILPEIIKLAHR